MECKTEKGNLSVCKKELDKGQYLHQGSLRGEVRHRGEDHRDFICRRSWWNFGIVSRLQLRFGCRDLLRFLLQTDCSQIPSAI